MDEATLDGWALAGRAAGQEVAAWRRAHPRATLTEIELAVEAAVSRLQGRLVEDLANGAGADLTTERPACAECGQPMVRRGRRKRAVLLARRATPLPLDREYWSCSSCGTGLSPLDEELGLVPGGLSPRPLEAAARQGTRQTPAGRRSPKPRRRWRSSGGSG